MFCPNCGTQVPDGSSNCPSCGHQFAKNTPAPTPIVQQSSNTSGASGVKQPRNVALAIVLSIVTCGIYAIYWFIVLTDETNQAAGETNGTSGGIAFLLTLVTCGIYGWYWSYKQGEKIDKAKNMRNIPSSNSGVLYLILQLLGFGIVAYALMQNELNKMNY